MIGNQVNNNPVQPQGINDEIDELNLLLQEVQSSPLPKDLEQKAVGMVNRLKRVAKYGSFSREYEPIAKYISWITKVPWGEYTTDNLDINNVKAQLDSTHYGLENVKQRLLEYIAMLNLRMQQQNQKAPSTANTGDLTNDMMKLQGSSSHAPILCFVGVQGIGKTSIAKSIAKALGRRFVRISLGALGGVTELRGRSRGEVDAEPGQVTKALVRAEVMSPLILMDEIDKVSSQTGLRADVMAALLEILDPEQNSTYLDHYLDYPLDLSHAMFICTANNLGGISAALLDRLEIVRMSSYNDDEKMHIAKDYLLPKVMESSGLTEQQIVFHDDVWPYVIRPLGFDAGIRELERTLTTLVRKIAMKIVTGEGQSFEITPQNFRDYIPEDIGVYS
ncbi:AAA family ATPase [Candidatus Dojkabacteria bacterium]|uniref:AAA family ATPase n=1 Tax=Candidatus Dojkabacteria bacterium TaxID=2099670 RepID=A0A955L4X8_9BACT|nr:AAA family ATPase [Candidatus Dojkabacteria bacterium]